MYTYTPLQETRSSHQILVKLNLNCNHDMFTSKKGGDKNFDTTIKIKNVLYVKKWNYSLSFKIL